MISCDKNSDDPKEITITNGKTNQTVYADQTSVNDGNGIRFKATEKWTATVTETTTKAAMAGRVDWLELNAYEGDAGEFALTMTLQPNTTGSDRKATISIVCGETKITITVEQKGTKEDGTIPEVPVVPTDPSLSGKLITKIEEIDYSDGKIDGTTPTEITYDYQNRVVKIVTTEVDETDGIPGVTSITTVTTANITYDDYSVAYEIDYTENGVAKSYKDSGSITLDGKQRATGGTRVYYEYKGVDGNTPYKFSDKYTLTYDADGHLTESNSNSVEGDDPNKEILKWTDGNLTEVYWGDAEYVSGYNGDYTHTATYGTVLNKGGYPSQLDLNWMYVLDSEGFDFAAGDPMKIFVALGYIGNSTKNMAEQVKGEGYHKYEYTVDSEGYITTITEYYKSKADMNADFEWEKSSVYKITYNK